MAGAAQKRKRSVSEADNEAQEQQHEEGVGGMEESSDEATAIEEKWQQVRTPAPDSCNGAYCRIPPRTSASTCALNWQYFLDDDAGLENYVQEFVATHSDVFDLTETEQPARYAELHAVFRLEFSEKIEVACVCACIPRRLSSCVPVHAVHDAVYSNHIPRG